MVKHKKQIYCADDAEYGSRPEQQETRKLKLVTVGDANAGKTSLILRFAEGVFGAAHSEVSLGVSSKRKELRTDDDYCSVALWDTAGTERFSSLSPLYLRNANGVLFVCDLRSLESIRNLRRWAQCVEQTMSFDKSTAMLIVNKADLTNGDGDEADDDVREAMEEVKRVSRELGIDYVLTSAKKDDNVTPSFYRLIGSIYDSVFKQELTQEGPAQGPPASLMCQVTRSANLDSMLLQSDCLADESRHFYRSASKSKSACC